MQHSFDIELANKYGIEEAILLNNICFWVHRNEANEQNLHDGCYWTFNSKKAFAKLFPYMTERKVKYALDNLRKFGLIKTGCYNESAYDKTLWYTLTDFGYEELGENNPRTILSNGVDESVQPIPDINSDINIINKKVSKVEISDEIVNDTLSFPVIEKQDNVFSATICKHGKDDADWAMGIVKSYIDEYYPKVKGRKHPKLNKAQRMSFARKFLDFLNDYYIADSDPLKIFKSILADKQIPDPTILIATDPKVLGYHALKIGCVDYSSLQDTEYCPVENYY